MLAFLGLSVLMGAVYKPRIPMHWSTNAIYQTYIFPSVMPRDRILLILRFLDFADNSAFNASNPNRDRLWKIREFTQMVHQRCKEVFTPGRDLCVDESLLRFKGRLGFKQFIKTKRVRFGIKLFELCTKTSILLDFLVYSGDMTKELITVPERDFLMSECILLNADVDAALPAKGIPPVRGQLLHSPRLAQFLLENNTTLVDTVRPNRQDFSADLVTGDIGRGESVFAMSDSGMLAVKYRAAQDKANEKPKIVYMLTTAHTNEIAASSKKRQRRQCGDEANLCARVQQVHGRAGPDGPAVGFSASNPEKLQVV